MAMMRDPLSFHTASNEDTCQNETSLKQFFLRMESAYYSVYAVAQAQREGNAQLVVSGEAQLRSLYSRHASEVQAALLVVYFSDNGERPVPHKLLKPVANKFLMEWFDECDVKSAHGVLKEYLEAAKTNDPSIGDGGFAKSIQAWVDNDTIDKSSEVSFKQIEAIDSETEARHTTIMAARASAGLCTLCGQPLTWMQKVVGSKSHKACKSFQE